MSFLITARINQVENSIPNQAKEKTKQQLKLHK